MEVYSLQTYNSCRNRGKYPHIEVNITVASESRTHSYVASSKQVHKIYNLFTACVGTSVYKIPADTDRVGYILVITLPMVCNTGSLARSLVHSLVRSFGC